MKAVQPITVGVAIDKPTNTLFGPAMSNDSHVPMLPQQLGNATLPVQDAPAGTAPPADAGEGKPYPGGAAPTNTIVLPGDHGAARGPPAQPALGGSNQTTQAPVPTTPHVPVPNPGSLAPPAGPAAPASIPQRTPFPKPLPTFARAAPAQPLSTRPVPVQPSYAAPGGGSVQPAVASGDGKEVVVGRSAGSRRLLKA